MQKSTPDHQKFKIRHLPSLLKETYFEWINDNPFRLSAIVAYFALLSLPPLLIIIINTVGYVWGPEIVAGKLTDEFASILGKDSAAYIKNVITNVKQERKTVIATIIGIATLLYGSTGVFYHLQLSMNTIWSIQPNPKLPIQKIAIDRVKGFGFVLIIGFLLLISFIITALITAFNQFLSGLLPELFVILAFIIDLVFSIVFIALLFALIFKYLPDAKIQWRTVAIGSLITSSLFVAGKYLLGFYFSQVDPGSTYGAASSVVLILLWVSYSCLILFFGAEFTFVYAKRYGQGIQPNKKAVKLSPNAVANNRRINNQD